MVDPLRLIHPTDLKLNAGWNKRSGSTNKSFLL